MTSFVTSASTMFGRRPLRSSTKQKEPSIGSPVLVDSTRNDVLMLSESNGNNNMSESYQTTRYTTTPNFEASPITPSQAVPPVFFQIPGPEEMQPKRNIFTRKNSSAHNLTNKAPKSMDLMEAIKQNKENSKLSSTLSPRRGKSQKVQIAKVESIAPRIRDSIVPTMNPIIDKSFLGFDDDSDKENDVPDLITSDRLSPRHIPRLRVATSADDILNRGRFGRRSSSEDSRGPYTPSSATIQISIGSDIINTDRFKAPVPKPTAMDEHISELEAQRDRLTYQQRETLDKIANIKTMLPPYPSTHDRKQREALREELREMQALYDSIGKEIHETGMMLHRAWRRRDVKLGLEAPAVLWVRRVNT